MDWNKVKKAIGIQPKIMDEPVVEKTPEELRREALAKEMTQLRQTLRHFGIVMTTYERNMDI